LTDCLKGRRSEVCYKNSEATDITVTAANIVYGVEHDAAGNVRSTTKAARTIKGPFQTETWLSRLFLADWR